MADDEGTSQPLAANQEQAPAADATDEDCPVQERKLQRIRDRIRNRLIRWSALGVAFVGTVSFFGNFATILGMFGARTASSEQVESLQSELEAQREMIAQLLVQTTPEGAIIPAPRQAERAAAAARVVERRPDAAKAIASGDYRTGFAALQANADDLSEEAATAWRDLGALAFDQNPAISLEAYRQAARIDPHHYGTWRALAVLEFDQAGDLMASKRAALNAMDAAEDDKSRWWAAVELGDLELEQGDFDSAARRFQEIDDALRPQMTLEGVDDSLKQIHSRVLEGMGYVAFETENIAEAETAFREMISIRRQLYAASPGDLQRRKEVSNALENIADLEMELGNLSAAKAASAEGMAIDRQIALDYPDSLEAQRNLSVGLEKYGDALMAHDKPQEAITYYTDSIQIIRLLLAGNPTNAELREDLSMTLVLIAEAHLALDDQATALTMYQEAVTLLRGIVTDNPDSIRAKLMLATALTYAGVNGNDAVSKEEAIAMVQSLSSHSSLVQEDLMVISEILEILGVAPADG